MKYPEDCVVIDNPPFSFLASICDWYNENEIDYFLFAPFLTNFNSESNHIIINGNIVYENGARVATAFLTNMGDAFIEADSRLQRIIEAENRKNQEQEERKLNVNKYPDELITSTSIGYLARHGVDFKLKKEECSFTRALDAQKEDGKAIMGSGFLISKEAAKRMKMAKEQADENNNKEVVEWKLSEREQAIVDNLGVK
jgi:parB-like nuclease|nr:MAG TPA: hypothetical protein [Caudoviricetes sp.]